jgi:zinc protease
LIVLLLALLCAPWATCAAQSPAASSEQAQLTVLPNGLRVLTQEMHAAPVVSVYVWYRVGSRNEHVGITGISHFVEHMMFKGSTHFGPGEASRLITRAGGWDNGMTWLDYTAYLETLPAAALDLALRIEADRMAHATFAPKQVESEKTVVLSEREGDANDPGFYLSMAVRAAAFMAHPYHSPTIGWKSDVLAYDRAEAVKYYDTHYAPNNATLVIVGDFNTGAALKRVRDLFGPIAAKPAPPKVITVEPKQAGERRVMVRRPGASGMIEMAFHVPDATHPDHYALDIIESVLGTGRTSRLYQALVEKHLAVSAEAANYTNLDPTVFEVYVTLPRGVTHEQAEKAALTEIERLTTDLISERELQRAKNQAKASFVYGSDSVSSLGYRLGFFDIVANYRLLYEYVARIDAVTREQVRDAARAYLGADNRTVGWFIPTGGAGPAAPAAPGGPLSRYGGVPRRGTGTAQVSVSSGPAPVSPGAPLARKPTRIELPNGAVFIVYHNPVAPAVSIRGMVGGGSVFDPPDKPGLANFVAEMLSRGAAKRSAEAIAEALEFVAAEADFTGGTQVATISARCLKDDLPLVIEILAEEARQPTFPDDQVSLVRMQLEVALREALDDPGEVADRMFYATLYPVGHPLHYRPLGTLEGVGAITRQDLVGFHTRYYRPDTLVLAVAGDVTTDQVRQLAQRYFGDWTAQGPRPVIIIPPVEPPAQVVRKLTPLAGKSQANVVIGLPGIARTAPDYPAADLMNYDLGGGGFASRMMEHIREDKGLAYYVYSNFVAYEGPGPWITRMGVDPPFLERAVDIALSEMKRIREQPPTDAEMRYWKDYVTGTLAVHMETNAGIAAALSEAAFYGLGLDYPWRYPELVRQVTAAQAADAARKYILPERCVISIAGPEPASAEKLEK